MSFLSSSARTPGPFDSAQPHEDVDGDALCEAIMAVDVKESGQIGCAYYIAAEEALCLYEDVTMAGMDLVETFLLHTQPTTVIAMNRAPDRLIEYLESSAQGVDEDRASSMQWAYVLRTVGSSELSYDAAKGRLLCLDSAHSCHPCTILTSTAEDDADGDFDDESKQSRLTRLATKIDLDSRLSVGCAGAVSNELQRRRAANYLPDDPDATSAFRVRSLRMVTLKGCMSLSRFALVSNELREAAGTLAGGEGLLVISKRVNETEPRELVRVGEMIHSVVDFDQSMQSNRTAVRPGVSAELDDLKHRYDGLDDFLSQVAARLAQLVPEWACRYVRNCIFYPQLGFLTVVSVNPETGRGGYEGEGIDGDVWEAMSVNGGHVYYKNAMMRDLDAQVGDIYCMIVDKEMDIIHELAVGVLEREASMTAAFGALITYMAHIGSFVPAAQATIGLTDRILTRMATRESLSRNESAFSIDLKQAAFSMNFATRRSLVPIDEFGKGTSANNGAGLMTALLEHFLGLGQEIPRVLVATHLHEVFESGLLTEGSSGLAFAHMDVRVDLETPRPEDQVTHLYRLVHGRSTSSFGSVCAAMSGVDSAVVDRAEALMLLMARNEDLKAACARLSEEEERGLEEAELVAGRFVEMELPTPAPRRAGIQGPARDAGTARGMLRDIVLVSNGESSDS